MVTALFSGVAAPAFADSPAHRNLDSNGVDLTLGDFVMAFPEGSVGSGEAELTLIRTGGGSVASQWDEYKWKVSGGQITISRPDRRSDTFSMPGPNSTIINPNGSSLTRNNSSATYIYRTPEGVSVAFYNPNYDEVPADTYYCSFNSPAAGCAMLVESITSPNGNTVYPFFFAPVGSAPTLYSVSNGFGYSISFTYSGTNRTRADFKRGSTIVGSVSYSYPAGGGVDVTDMAGNVWHVTNTSITRPGESSPSFSVSGTTNVTSATRDGVTTSYSRTVSGATSTMVVTNALGKTSKIVSNLTLVRPTSITDELNKTKNLSYDSYGRLTQVTQPEGNYTHYTYDSRGNVTETREVARLRTH